MQQRIEEGCLGTEGPEDRDLVDIGLDGNEARRRATEAMLGVDALCGVENSIAYFHRDANSKGETPTKQAGTCFHQMFTATKAVQRFVISGLAEARRALDLLPPSRFSQAVN